jgi:hypothetical protein
MFFQIRTIVYLRKTGYELEAAQTTFRLGPRVGLGEDIAMMEMKVVARGDFVKWLINIDPDLLMTLQIVRRYHVKVQSSGRFAVDGGVA